MQKKLWSRLTDASKMWLTATLAINAGLVLYWIHFYRGPYRAMIEWESSHYGRYSPENAVKVSVLAALFIETAIVILMVRWGWIETQGIVTPDPDPLAAAETIRGLSSGLRSHRYWMRDHKIRLAFLGASLFLFGLGVRDLWLSNRAGPRVDVEVAQLHAGSEPPSSWLCISGRALEGQSVAFVDAGGKTNREEYIPLVETGWNPAQPVKVFLRRTKMARSHNSACYEGLLIAHGLPAQFEDEFRKSGIRSAPEAVIIDWGQTPSGLKIEGILKLIIGSIMGTIVLLIWKFKNKSGVAH